MMDMPQMTKNPIKPKAKMIGKVQRIVGQAPIKHVALNYTPRQLHNVLEKAKRNGK